MSCNSCANPFSLLRKEKGCPNCGFSFCSKCLVNKIYIPKHNSEAKVCAKCKKTLTLKEVPVVQPPDAYYKRLAAVDNLNHQNNSKSPDDEIAERLNKLRENKKPDLVTTNDEIAQRLQKIKGEIPSTSDAELHSRLARLKGVPDIIQSKSVLPALDLRTEQEQADDLLKQYMQQTNIDTKYKDEFDELISDMESRVKNLKGTKPPDGIPLRNEEHVESEDEEDTIKKILQKVKTEVKLEDNEISSPNDELPFCEICNEDATMRCLGCRYLFCKRCFMDHRDDDDGCNKYEPYKPPRDTQY